LAPFLKGGYINTSRLLVLVDCESTTNSKTAAMRSSSPRHRIAAAWPEHFLSVVNFERRARQAERNLDPGTLFVVYGGDDAV
jgi:hypothetical protein